MPDGPPITLQGITKRFDQGPLVLKDVSFKANRGEIVVIIGPSGCGKSTLLRIIAGLIEPDEGTIDPMGVAVDPAFIFQDATLLPWASVIDNIALPARLKGTARDKRYTIAREWADRLGLGHVLEYYPRQLSGGMSMRVSIARALSQSPNLLLLDEPFGALDAITRNRLNEVLLDLHQQSGWTAFFITHSVTEAVFLSNRIVIMGNNPERGVSVMDNPLPDDRDAHTRESLAFQQLVAEATANLQKAMES